MLPVDGQTVACRCAMFDNFAVLVTPSINRVVEFAKRIPGSCSTFSDIGCCIYTILLCFCFLLVSVAYCFGLVPYHNLHFLLSDRCCLF